MKTKCFLLVLLFICAGLYTALAQNPQKYAVIITGDAPGDGYQGQFANPNSNYNEFWNDTYLMWEMLVTKFGFDHTKVFVLYAEGTDYVSQNPRYTYINAAIPGLTHITDYSATISNVQNKLGGLVNGSNGMPQMTQDDFLFIFTFGHGVLDATLTHGALQLQDGIMLDTQFGELVNAIPANKRVIWMQNCASGDFAEELTNDKNYFVAATMPYPNGGLAMHADNCYTYQGTNYCNIPQLEEEIVDNREYSHGEFIFHLYSSANGKTPTGITYYVQSPAGNFTNVDVNSDGYKTFTELFNYVDVQDSQQQPNGPDNPNASDFGNIGNYTSFEYPTLLHDNLTQANLTCRGLIGISNTATVRSGSTLTIAANSKVHLLNGGNLIVEAGANLVIENGVQFIKSFPASANKIEINGTLSACNYVSFDGGTGSLMLEVITNNVTGSFMFDHCIFNNTAYKGSYGLVTMDNSTFTKSYCSIGSTFPQENLVYIRYNVFQGNSIAYPAININGMKK